MVVIFTLLCFAVKLILHFRYLHSNNKKFVVYLGIWLSISKDKWDFFGMEEVLQKVQLSD
jgi:hypothetical protein